MTGASPRSGHNGGPPLEDASPDQGCCKQCRRWRAPPEGEQRAYEAFRLGLSRRRVTLDQMLECLISIRHPAADRYKAVLEAIGTVMAEGSPNAFASPPAPHAFRGSPSPEPAPRSGPHFPTSPAPRRSSHSIPTAGRRNLRRSTPHPDNAL